MKANYKIILVLAMTAAMLLIANRPCWAVKGGKENIWEDEPRVEYRRIELTDERIEHIMNRLRETNPEKAKELEKLRSKDPEKFKAEIRDVMYKQFGKKFKEEGKKFREEGKRFREQSREFRRRGMHERHAEHLEWLEKNYPEEAKKLVELREKKPELYTRRLGLGLKRYGRIMEAAKENPELAQALKEDLELKEKRDKLLGKIRAATDDDEKKELVKELEEVINSRFDLIVKRKQIKYELLSKKLEKLKKRVERSEAEIVKWKESKFKNENVKARLEELISQTEKVNWD